MMRRVLFWLITLGAILGAYLTYNANPLPREYANLTAPNEVLHSPDAAARGRATYLANCAACHGARGDGRGATKPAFGLQPVDFSDRARMDARAPQYLFWRVSEGGRDEPFRARGSIMPAWKYQLTPEQRWQVVAYIQTLAR